MQVGNAGGAFVALKASDIVRPEVGNSEKLIVSAFETARLNAPSVIFIDEFQVSFDGLWQTIYSVCSAYYIIYQIFALPYPGFIWR